MLLKEAGDITGLNFKQLDQVLGFEEGYCRRYSLFPKKCRAPQAGRLQDLEDRVAKLLCRPAHAVVLENLTSTLGAPCGGMNARDNDKHSLWFTYEDGWPTYDCLIEQRDPGLPEDWRYYKSSPRPKLFQLVRDGVDPSAWPDTLRLYSWQWGVLWDRGVPGLSRDEFGVAPNVSTEEFIAGELMKRSTALAHGGKGSFKSSFYCDSGDLDFQAEPPDEYFDDLSSPSDEATAEQSPPEICRKGTVVFADFQKRRVMKSLVKSSD